MLTIHAILGIMINQYSMGLRSSFSSLELKMFEDGCDIGGFSHIVRKHTAILEKSKHILGLFVVIDNRTISEN